LKKELIVLRAFYIIATMSPLMFQNYDPKKQDWYLTGKFGPRDGVGYVVDYVSTGKQRLFVFECAPDDTSTTVYLNEGRIRVTNDAILEMMEKKELKVFKVLKSGESYETIVVHENGSKARQIRLLHSKER
jgi:hypothetical protein